MKPALRWHGEGNMHVAIDDQGWKRYIMYYEAGWEAVGPIGYAYAKPQSFHGLNKAKLMREIARDWRSRFSVEEKNRDE